jgi:cell division protein FtsZ
LLEIVEKRESLVSAFRKADEVLRNAVQGISDLITVPGLINLDFADVRTVMANMGIALMGTGISEGESRAVNAANMAIHSPLLEDTTVDGAKGILINISASSDLTLMEVSEASEVIEDAADEEAHIIFGAVLDDNLGPFMKVTVIATGFDQRAAAQAAAAQKQRVRSLVRRRSWSCRRKRLPPPARPAVVEPRRSVVDLGEYKRPAAEAPSAPHSRRKKMAEAAAQLESAEPDYQNLEIPTLPETQLRLSEWMNGNDRSP